MIQPTRRPVVRGEGDIGDGRHTPLDPGGDRRRRVLGPLEVVLQVPAQVSLVLGGEVERESGDSSLPRHPLAFDHIRNLALQQPMSPAQKRVWIDWVFLKT